MGAAPSILQVLAFGPIVFLTWALGPNFNTKFRLVGPWKWDGAAAIMKEEHWKVIKRRKGFISKFELYFNPSILGWSLADMKSFSVWTCMSILPITIFGTLSLVYLIVYGVKDALAWPFLHLGGWREETSMKPIRGQDLSGMKRARALKEARGPQKVLKD